MSLVEGASTHRIEFNCKWFRVPTCTGSLILNQQVLLFLTSGLLQLALVAIVFAVGATNLQESQEKEDENTELSGPRCILYDFLETFYKSLVTSVSVVLKELYVKL